MKLRGDGATVDLIRMGWSGGGDPDEPVRTAVIDLVDGQWALQDRGGSAPRRNFRGEFIPDDPDDPAAEWAKLRLLKGKELSLVETTNGAERVVGKGRLIGSLRLETPDVRNGRPVWRRWRFSIAELPP